MVPWDQATGGVASVVGNLGRYLEAEGHSVLFLNPGASRRPVEKRTKWGFSGFELPLRPPVVRGRPIRGFIAFLVFLPVTLYWIMRLIRAHRVDIVNLHYPLRSFIYFALCQRIMPFRLVTSVHGADLFPEGRPKRGYAASMVWLLRTSDLIVAPSRHYMEDVLSLFPELGNKATFIHNGVDLQELHCQQDNTADGRVGKYLLCIAHHNRRKGLDVLIKAFAELNNEYPALRLLLAGDGPLRAELEDLARSLALQERVAFLGRRSRTEIPSLIMGCEAVVVPSIAESFGIVVLEGMACRKPVVASGVGGIPEIITSGQDGLLVEPGNPAALADALRTVLEDEELRDTIAANGYQTVKRRFEWRHTGARYLEEYSRLLAK